MDKLSLPSIEKFAAYLDGNLSPDEMQQFSKLAEHNDVLRQLIEAGSAIDDALSKYTESDLQLPEEIIDMDFDLPEIGIQDSIEMPALQDLQVEENISSVLQDDNQVFNQDEIDSPELSLDHSQFDTINTDTDGINNDFNSDISNNLDPNE